jgi:alkanesulfonate monooxygenase SsuD/methylene tetrahydromethanopterin reductase-like flavin-dependent oxidoreductase (luciferase family)
VIRVGLDVHESILAQPPEAARGLVQRAADSGLDFLVVGDHLSFQGGQGFDGIVSATLALAAHPTLPVLVGVYQLALRHPLAVARQLSSIAQVAPGRLVLGVGAGGEDRLEVLNAGVDPTTRGRRLDESMRVLRLLATGSQVDFGGEFFQLRQALVLPVPAPPIPIVVGGRSPAALRRAALLGDGWLPMFVSPRRFKDSVARIAELAATAGRELTVRPTLSFWCGLDADAGRARALLGGVLERLYSLPYEQFRNLTRAGSPVAVAEALIPYVEAGCRDFSLLAVAGSWEAAVEQAAEVRQRLIEMASSPAASACRPSPRPS